MAVLVSRIFFGVSTEGEGIFGEDPGAEKGMKELREEEPMMEANILTKLDEETERENDDEEANQTSNCQTDEAAYS